MIWVGMGGVLRTLIGLGVAVKWELGVWGTVAFSDTLTLHPEDGGPFFYSVSEATVTPGFDDRDPAPMVVPKQHRNVTVQQTVQTRRPFLRNHR